jgi:hypothetical protein
VRAPGPGSAAGQERTAVEPRDQKLAYYEALVIDDIGYVQQSRVEMPEKLPIGYTVTRTGDPLVPPGVDHDNIRGADYFDSPPEADPR